jgi:hypothetical protein
LSQKEAANVPWTPAARRLNRLDQLYRYVLVACFLVSLGIGLLPTTGRLRQDVISLPKSQQELRRDSVAWYRRLEAVFADLDRSLPTDASILLKVDGVPHWFAPYYLAPRRFYYSNEAAEEMLIRRNIAYWELELNWRRDHVEWRFEKSVSEMLPP